MQGLYFRNIAALLTVYIGPRHPDWSLSFEIKNQMLEDFFELSTELSWEEMRSLSAKGTCYLFGAILFLTHPSGVVVPRPQEIVSVPLCFGKLKLEFITSTIIKAPLATVITFLAPTEKLDSTQVFYLHGGGYCLGSIENYRSTLLEFSKATGFRYLAIDYSLAPENPYPVALNECLEASIPLPAQLG